MHMEKLVIGNLKMNILSAVERERYFGLFKKEITKKIFPKVQIVLCPPFIHLESFEKNLGKKVRIGAQDMFWEREGSFTGEISPAQLKNFGMEYVIIGHSERRRYFGEGNEVVNLKISAALKIGLKPVICVGETKQERDRKQTLGVITKQVREALKDISRTKAQELVIAYEPIWAVGTDVVPTANEIMEAKLLIRKILVNMYEKRYADQVRIIYGGSVNAKTVEEVCLEPAMDGALIGRESLIPYEFIKIAEILND
jgi:triosephosphate isomerase (TIM)